MPRKRSFFEKLTGVARFDDVDEDEYNDSGDYDEESFAPQEDEEQYAPESPSQDDEVYWSTEEPAEEEGQLSVDVLEERDAITIKALVAGVSPDDLDITITREMVTIRGDRQDRETAPIHDYLYQELYWGPFSRTIVLPQEIEVEESEARERHGLLAIHLPKINKDRETKIRVKSN